LTYWPTSGEDITVTPSSGSGLGVATIPSFPISHSANLLVDYQAAGGVVIEGPQDDYYVTHAGTTLNVPAATGVLANDVAPSGTTPTAKLLTEPSQDPGLILDSDGSFSYLPTTGFVGLNTFTYEDLPDLGGTDVATVTIDVLPNTTSVALAASNTNPTVNEPVTLTADITESDAPATGGLAGTVVFTDNSANASLGEVSINDGAPGEYVLTVTLAAGTHSITATFAPTSNNYNGSTSPPVVVTVVVPTACSDTGSVCSDTQNLQATINPGTITITTPYTAWNPFVLPAMALSSDGTYLQSSATFPKSTDGQIVVTSTLAPAYAWTLSVSATPPTSGSNQIPASGFGLTVGTLLNASGSGAYSGTVTFTNIPALNPSPADGPGTGPGLSATPQTFARSTAVDGNADMDGTLTLYASTSTPAGTYTGTVTFSVS
jgi:hypothetical protein